MAAIDTSYVYIADSNYTIGDELTFKLKSKLLSGMTSGATYSLSLIGNTTIEVCSLAKQSEDKTVTVGLSKPVLRKLLSTTDNSRKVYLRVLKGESTFATLATLTVNIDDYSAELANAFVCSVSSTGVSRKGILETYEYLGGANGLKYEFSANTADFNSTITSTDSVFLTRKAYQDLPEIIGEDALTVNGWQASGSVTVSALPDVTSGKSNYYLDVLISDSRGKNIDLYYPSETGYFRVVPYSKPRCSTLTVNRCLENGTLDGFGKYAKLEVSASCSLVNSEKDESGLVTTRNYITAITAAWRQKGATEWSAPVEVLENTKVLGDGAFDIDNSFEFLVSVSDRFTTVSQILTLPTASCAFMLRAGGKGASFGTAETADNLLRVAWDTKVDGNLTVLGAISSGKSESVTYTWGNKAVAANENIFDITLPDYMNEVGGVCEVTMQFKFATTVSAAGMKSGYMLLSFDGDTANDNYVGNAQMIGSSGTYQGRRISMGFAASAGGKANYYRFTIHNIEGGLYVEGTSSSYYGSDGTHTTLRYVISYTGAAAIHTLQIYPSVAVANTGSATITIRKGR